MNNLTFRGQAWSIRLLFGALLVLLTGPMTPLAADVLRLKNGNSFEGRVRLLDGDYEVFVEPGRVFRVKVNEVVELQRGTAPYDTFLERLAAIDAKDRAGLEKLALWAEDKRLRNTALRAYRRLLRVDPHHAGARDRLGFVLYRNRWVLRQDLEDQGLVRFRGLWMEPVEVERIRTEEAIADFKTLLQDVHHENRYLRENALLTVAKEKDPRLIPFLRELTRARDPLERLVAARVLAHHDFDSGAEAVYAALLIEARDEVRASQLAALRGYGDQRLLRWVTSDLARTDLPVVSGRNLFRLCEVCPHASCVPAIITKLEDRGWAPLADRTLRALFRREGGSVPQGSSATVWAAWWAENQPRIGSTIGSDWLK